MREWRLAGDYDIEKFNMEFDDIDIHDIDIDQTVRFDDKIFDLSDLGYDYDYGILFRSFSTRLSNKDTATFITKVAESRSENNNVLEKVLVFQ